MGRFVGVDGCRAGWVAVTTEGKQGWEVSLHPDFAELMRAYADSNLILVDMPIGFLGPGERDRTVDLWAKSVLGKRRSSVFLPPCREAIYASSYQEACAINRAHLGKAFSIQAWNIVPKIREVDTYLRAHLADVTRVREGHPEICFWALNGRRPMQHNKKTEEGRAERMALLRPYLSDADVVLEHGLTTFKRSQLVADDLVDAMVEWVVACHSGADLVTMPERAESDGCSLPMEMVFWDRAVS